MKKDTYYYLTTKEYRLYPTKEQKKVLDREFAFFLKYKKALFKKALEHERETGTLLTFKTARTFGEAFKDKMLSTKHDFSKYEYLDHFNYGTEVLSSNRLHKKEKKNDVCFKNPLFQEVNKRTIKLTNCKFDEKHFLLKDNCAIRIRPNYDNETRFHFYNISYENGEYKMVGVTFKRPVHIAKSKKACGIDMGFKNFLTIYDSNDECQVINLDCKKIDKLVKGAVEVRRILKHNLEKNGHNYKSKNAIKLATRLRELDKRIDRIRTYQYNQLAKLIVFNYDFIAMEDLNSIEYSENIKFRTMAFKYSYGSFKKIIQNQAKKYNKCVYFCNRYFPSSQICSECGELHKDMDDFTNYKDRMVCNCGNNMDRDANAARNLMNKMISDLDIGAYLYKKNKPHKEEIINEGNLLFDMDSF